jgi:hypothetical protein
MPTPMLLNVLFLMVSVLFSPADTALSLMLFVSVVSIEILPPEKSSASPPIFENCEFDTLPFEKSESKPSETVLFI